MLRAIPPILTLCVLLVGHAFAATSYTYVTVEPKPEWNAIHLFLFGMDDLGKMVGSTVEANGASRPWRYVPGVQPSPMMRWNQGAYPKLNFVSDINSRGWLVQISLDSGANEFANYCKPTPCTPLKNIHPSPTVAKITNSLHVVGSFAKDVAGYEEMGEVGYIQDLVTNATALVIYPGRQKTMLTGMNDDGMAMGFAYNDFPGYITEETPEVSFIYQDGQFYPFVIPGTLDNQLISVNNRGSIVGLAFYEQDILSFVLHPSGEFLEISVPDSLSTFVSDVNSRGVIGGSYLRADGVWRGFVAWPQVIAETTAVALGTQQSDAPVGMNAAALETSNADTLGGITVEAPPLRENFRMDEPLRLQVCAGAHQQYGRSLPGCPR